MASELAKKIALAALTTDADQPSSEVAVDAELQEVRGVLDSLRQSRDCWCVATWKGTHDGRCQRARDLMEKLEVKP